MYVSKKNFKNGYFVIPTKDYTIFVQIKPKKESIRYFLFLGYKDIFIFDCAVVKLACLMPFARHFEY